MSSMVMVPNDSFAPSKRQMPNYPPSSGGLPPLSSPTAPFVFQGGAGSAPFQTAQASHSKLAQRQSGSYVPFAADDHRATSGNQAWAQGQYPTTSAYSTTSVNRGSEAPHRVNTLGNYSMQGYGTSAPIMNSPWRGEPHVAQSQHEVPRNLQQQYPSTWLAAPAKDVGPSMTHPYAQHASPLIPSQNNGWQADNGTSSSMQRHSIHDHYPGNQPGSHDGSEPIYGSRMSNVGVGIPDLQANSPWTSTAVPLRDTYPGGSRQSMVTGISPTISHSSTTGQYDYHNGGLPSTASYGPSSAGNSTSYHSPAAVLSTPSSDAQSLNQGAPYGQWSLNLMSPPSSMAAAVPSSRGAYQDDESRWQGVATRSHHADKFYLYGALTTHIYCRPSCASKRPSRDRVQFFPYPDAAAAAEAAGFRSCKRCKPDRSGSDQTVLAVGDCVRHMMMSAASSAKEGGEPKKRTLKEYAARAGLSTFHFHRSLAKVMSITPGEYAKASQSMALQDALGIDNAPPGYGRISSKTYEDALTGWSARRAKRALGNIDPAAYSSGDLGIPIVRTSVQDTVYGPVSLVYASGPDGSSSLTSRPRYPGQATPRHDRAIFALLFGHDADQRLARRFPTAALGDVGAQQEVASILDDLRRSAIREEQLPPETVASIRRARLWAVVRKRLANHAANGLVGFGDHHDVSGDEDGYE